MKFAVIGDIHSNIYALEKVLEDIRDKDVDFILCTGDMVGYSPFPNEVIDLLRKSNVLSVQGNYDKAVGNSEILCGCDYTEEKELEMAGLSVMFTNREITDKNRIYLKELPTELRLKTGEFQILLVHGSHRKNNEYLFEDSVEVDEVTKEIPEDILICGHTHKPYYRVVNGKHVINPGSAGKPKHGTPDAVYALVDISGKNISAHILEVPYDVEKAAAAIEENEILPNDFADMLRKG